MKALSYSNYPSDPGYGDLNRYVQIDSRVLDDLLSTAENMMEDAKSVRDTIETRSWDSMIEQVSTLILEVKKVRTFQEETLECMRTVIVKGDSIDQQVRNMDALIDDTNDFKAWWASQLEDFQQLIVTQAVFKEGL